jgi:hypothetical protein
MLILMMFLYRCSSCETVLHGIEKQIQRSNNYRDIKATQKTKFDSEVCSVLEKYRDSWYIDPLHWRHKSLECTPDAP